MLYTRIIQDIEEQIDKGRLKPGGRLPSIRSLSAQLACSRNTVLKAYEELEKKHLVYSVAKSGYYVVEAPLERRTGTGTNDVIDFLSAGPDKAVIPYREFQHCLNQAIETYREDMFTYSDTLGLPSLRTELARHLRDLQVFAPPSRLAVVSGSQQALHLLVSLPFPNGRRGICVEQPTHPAMVESLRQQGVPVHGIEITGAGLDLDRLESLFRDEDIKLFYTVSRFHNPTGYSYTNTEKRRIVELAEKHDVYLIEDDYMGDLDADGKQDPMFAYEPSGRVIYTKSFSKVMLPGIRLGLAVLPDFLLGSFEAAKFASDLHSPVLTQGALEIYLRNGLFAAHIQRMRSLYRRKALLLQEACRKHLPASVSFTGALSGFYSTIGLPSPLQAPRLIEHLKTKNVLVDNARKMFLPEWARDNLLRLSVSQVEEARIEEGIRRIAESIRELLGSRTRVRFI